MLKRKLNQVSLEPYGYTLVRRIKSTLPASPQPEIQAGRRKTGSNAHWVTVIIIVVVMLFVLVNATKQPYVKRTSTYMDSSHDAGMACIMVEKLIKPQLKAPTTAEFDYADCKESAFHSGNTWSLRSYVDSDNSFGAHIRTYFTVDMTNIPPSDRWNMSNLSFD